MRLKKLGCGPAVVLWNRRPPALRRKALRACAAKVAWWKSGRAARAKADAVAGAIAGEAIGSGPWCRRPGIWDEGLDNGRTRRWQRAGGFSKLAMVRGVTQSAGWRSDGGESSRKSWGDVEPEIRRGDGRAVSRASCAVHWGSRGELCNWFFLCKFQRPLIAGEPAAERTLEVSRQSSREKLN